MNMSYCKFGNTLAALQQCAEDRDDPSNESEVKAKKWLIQLMAELLEREGHNVSLVSMFLEED